MKTFNGISISDYKKSRHQEVVSKIQAYSDDDILNLDEEELKIYLYDLFKLVPLEVANEPIEVNKPQKVNQPYYNAFGNGNVEVMKFTFEFAYKGSSELFAITPRTHTMTTYDIQICNSTVKLDVIVEKPEPEEFKKALESAWNEAFCNTVHINKDVAIWNSQLQSLIDYEFSKYKKKVKLENNFYASINTVVNEKTKSIYTVNTHKKVSIPQPVVQKDKLYTLDPALAQDFYDDVLMIIDMTGKSIEKKKSVYKGKMEEDLRDYFLPILETRYESTTTTGETFNKSGKTDILIKHSDGMNLFIAEFKIWSGSKALKEAINQLFDKYVTYRDTKTAIIVFVRTDNFTEITRKAKLAVQSHEYFKKEIINKDESAFRYEMHLPKDEKKIIQLEVQLFHIPE